MGTLRTELDRIASSFVASVLDAMRNASLSDLAETGGRASASVAAPARTRGRPRGARAAVATAVAAPARRRREAQLLLPVVAAAELLPTRSPSRRTPPSSRPSP